MFHLSEPACPRGSISLRQRQPVLWTRQTYSTHKRPFEFTADKPAAVWSEGKTFALVNLSHLPECARAFSRVKKLKLWSVTLPHPQLFFSQRSSHCCVSEAFFWNKHWLGSDQPLLLIFPVSFYLSWGPCSLAVSADCFIMMIIILFFCLSIPVSSLGLDMAKIKCLQTWESKDAGSSTIHKNYPLFALPHH